MKIFGNSFRIYEINEREMFFHKKKSYESKHTICFDVLFFKKLEKMCLATIFPRKSSSLLQYFFFHQILTRPYIEINQFPINFKPFPLNVIFCLIKASFFSQCTSYSHLFRVVMKKTRDRMKS